MKRLLVGLLLVNWSVWALSEHKQDLVEYRKAQKSDIPSILSLMEESASEADKLVVLPKACRESFVKDLIDKSYLFVALVGNEVVATKKLFIAEGAERDDVLKNVIRSEGEKARLSLRGNINDGGVVVFYEDTLKTPRFPSYGVCIYDGFDFTRKAFRGRGINTGLFAVAFESIMPQLNDVLRKADQKNITLLYGLTYANAGERPGMASDRTPGMAKAFQSFIKKFIDKKVSSVVLELARYHSVMPTFDQNSHDCKPLPEENGVPGYGYVLTYELKGNLV